ncbi:unnamed protein product, partial [Porites evermanni]
DARRRNSFKNQPELFKWNLLKLAEAIQDAVPLQESISSLEERFHAEFENCFLAKMRLKLGLVKKELPTDKNVITSLFDTMEQTGADFTNTFRCLCRVSPSSCTSTESGDEDVVEYLVSQCVSLQGMIKTTSNFVEWRVRLDQEFDGQQNSDQVNNERIRIMNSNNPRLILRNYIAQNAIEAAENGDFTVVQNLLRRLETPYSEDTELQKAIFPQRKSIESSRTSHHTPALFNISDPLEMYLDKPPDDALNMRLT